MSHEVIAGSACDCSYCSKQRSIRKWKSLKALYISKNAKLQQQQIWISHKLKIKYIHSHHDLFTKIQSSVNRRWRKHNISYSQWNDWIIMAVITLLRVSGKISKISVTDSVCQVGGINHQMFNAKPMYWVLTMYMHASLQ